MISEQKQDFKASRRHKFEKYGDLNRINRVGFQCPGLVLRREKKIGDMFFPPKRDSQTSSNNSKMPLLDTKEKRKEDIVS